MTNVGHLFDGSTTWEHRVGVSQLIDRLPHDRYRNHLAAIDASARTELRFLSRPIEMLPRIGGICPLCAPAIARFVNRRHIDLIHAWGVHAGAAACALRSTPMVIQLFDPLTAMREVKRLRALIRPQHFAVACSNQIVRRHLIEGGFPQDLAVVIRPAVDFASINRWRRGGLRERIGLTCKDRVAIIPEPVTRTAGSLDAVYAVALHHHLLGGLRVIIPGVSREQRRITRFAGGLPIANPLVTPGDGHPFEQLLSVSDVLLLTPRGDISTTSIAWAMAAGVAIIATAVPAITEMIAAKVNGLLASPRAHANVTGSIVRLLRDRASQEKAKEAARGQAYEVFSLPRYIEQTMQLYEHVCKGTAPGTGITDSAFDT